MTIFDIRIPGDHNFTGGYYDNVSIQLVTSRDGEDIIMLPAEGFTITYKNDRGVDIYKIIQAGIRIEINEDYDVNVNKIDISSGFTRIYETYRDTLKGKVRMLQKFLQNLIVKQRGREVLALKNVGSKTKLPHNVEGVIGEMLTGKKGHIVSQTNQLRQELGEHLAPQVRNTRKNTPGK